MVTIRALPFVLFLLSGCATAVDPDSISGTGDSGRADTGVPTTDSGNVDTGAPVIDSAVADTAPDVDTGPCRLVINELQTGIAGNGNADFVEIHNACGTSATLDDYKLVYRSATGTTDMALFTFPAGTTIAGRGFVVIAGSGFSGSSDGALASGLAVGGGGVALRDDIGALVDSVGYGSASNIFVEGSAAPAPGDVSPPKSISRVTDGLDTDDNSADFRVGSSTPGASNAP